MPYLVLIVVLLALFLIPGFWVRRVMARYSEPEDRYPEAGGAFARRLLDTLGLHHVKTEATEQGDHYDPEARAVRLSPANFEGRSLTAVTVAAHEVGHAMQHAGGYPPLVLRTRLARLAVGVQRFGALAMIAAPIVLGLTRAPSAGGLVLLAGLSGMLLMVLVHLVTLPTEFDASFGRALPLLDKGNYLIEGDMPHARRLLRAAALTYVAAALQSLLNIGRWLAILRR